MPLRKIAPLLIALLLPAGIVSAQALNISNSPGVPSVNPRIVADAQGNAHAAWVEMTGTNQLGRPCGDVYYVMGDLAALQLGTPVKISTAGTAFCETDEVVSLAVDASGRVYIVWVEYDRVLRRIKDATGWGAPIVLATDKIYESPRIAVTAEGDIYIIYWNREFMVFSRSRVGGVWEDAQYIGIWGCASKMPDITVGAGSVGACYMGKDGVNDLYEIYYSERARGLNSTWSTPSRVAPTGADQIHPALCFDAADNPHVIWMNGDDGPRVIQYSRGTGSGFTSAENISSGDLIHFPFMAAGGGSFYVVWQSGGYGDGTAVRYNVLNASGAWSGVQSVPNSNGCTFADVAASEDGSVVYWVWDTLHDQSNGEIYGWAQSFAPVNPNITLGTSQLFFGAIQGGTVTPVQNVSVVNSGADPKSWTVADNQSWISVTPTSGSGSGRISVTADPSGLSAGTYSGTISVSDPNATEYLPKTITVVLNVYGVGASSGPFGSFDSPTAGATVMSSVPVTGWALDDVGVQSVKIYWGTGLSDRALIGDAVFVDGARPDVEQSYANYPLKRRAGWGYMLLTNFLPLGDGAYNLLAYATDLEGNEILLGNKTITVANLAAVNPFGAIDTPGQGGTASGAAFMNFGWALTPQPNSIPTDGSTIIVWVDSVALGHPVYNNYRADIATAFPGYVNSNGAVGYYSLDTTTYANGLHTIQWSVSDSAGHADGIGSRYFEVFNGAGAPGAPYASPAPEAVSADDRGFVENPQIPIYFRKGWDIQNPLQTALPGNDGRFAIVIRETERIEIQLDPEAPAFEPLRAEQPVGAKTSGRTTAVFRGFMDAGTESLPLPVGSSLDRETGTFSWNPGPGFIGEYRLVFLDAARGLKRTVTVRIIPKY